MTDPRVPLLLHRGDPAHGVDQYARTVADAVERMLGPGSVAVAVAAPDADPDAGSGLGGSATSAGIHIHFTDRLWGADAEAAAARIEQFAARGPVTVTLHDVPQPSDGVTGFARRSQSYARVVAAASGVVVNSRHEHALLEAALGSPVEAAVIPLPVPALPAPTAPVAVADADVPVAVTPVPAVHFAHDRVPAASVPAEPESRPEASTPTDVVAVLGFFYPGKGHREVVDAVALLPADERPGVIALGGASPKHERELADLHTYAAAAGVHFSSTGFLEPGERAHLMRSVAVPVIAHQHVSASGSLTDWIAAGRRPLTIDSPYFAEMLALRPGTVTLVPSDPASLAAAIAAHRRAPSTTWLDAGAHTSPHPDDTARAYLDWWSRS